MATVFLVDDHEVVRRGIADLIEAEPGLQVIGGASTATEALTAVSAAKPDIAVLDVRLPDGDGVGLCRELRSRRPELRCLMLTSFADDEAMFDAVMAGAAGFVLKDVVGAVLVDALHTVAAGQSLLNSKMVDRLRDRARRQQEQEDPLRKLTEREREVLELVVAGLTNLEIAFRLQLSENTVINHVSNLLGKLSLRNRVQAAVFATELRSRRIRADHYYKE
jgi:two-component system, NarL family, response regulator DevR